MERSRCLDQYFSQSSTVRVNIHKMLTPQRLLPFPGIETLPKLRA